MIRYALVCDKSHTFEIWFQNSGDYDKQRKRRLVTCPQCGSFKVEKTLMTPQLGRGTRKGRAADAPAVEIAPLNEAPTSAETATPVALSPQETELRAKIKELRDHLLKNSENVGPKFAEEARKIHYGETEHRSIHGIASAEDAEALHEEGIAFHPLPVLPEDRN